MKEEIIQVSDKELEQIKQYAALHSITEEEAATRLFSEGMEGRYRKRTGKGPASNVRKFRRKK